MVVLSSTNKYEENISGKIMDETYHTISVLSEKKIKKLHKKNIIFKVKKNDSWYTIKGNIVEYRPEDRIKKIK